MAKYTYDPKAIETKWQAYWAKEQTFRTPSDPQVLAAKPTAAYDAKIPGALGAAGAGTSADRFVRMLYSELKK